MSETQDSGGFVQELVAQGLAWDVRLLRAGASDSGEFISDGALREAAPLFDGVRVFAKSDQEAATGGMAGKDVHNIVGWVTFPKFIPAARSDAGELRARMSLVNNASVGRAMSDAWKRGKRDLVGLSVDIDAKTAPRRVGERTFREAVKVVRVRSVDLVTESTTGGALLRLVEAVSEAPSAAEVAEIERLVEARHETRRIGLVRILESGLPTPAKRRLEEQLATRPRLTVDDVTSAIAAERAYLNKLGFL